MFPMRMNPKLFSRFTIAIVRSSHSLFSVVYPFIILPPQKIPADSMYRKNVEKWYNFFTKVATEKKDVSLES